MSKAAVFLGCLLFCGCGKFDEEYRSKMIADTGNVPLPSVLSEDLRVKVAILNELRQIKTELRRMNDAKEGSR